MYFVSIAKNNLLNRPIRTIFTCLGVALGVASFIALIGLSKGVERAWENGLNEKGTHILAMRKGAAEILTATLDQSLETKIMAVAGVERVAGELVDLVQIDTGTVTLVTGWAVGGSLWDTLHIIHGNIKEAKKKGHIILGESISRALGEKTGDTISINGRSFVIRAVHQAKGALNNNSIIMTLSDMQELTGKTGRVTVFNIQLENNENFEQVNHILSRLRSTFDELAFQETRLIADNNKILKLFRAIAWGTSCIALLICAFVVLNTLLMSISERKREIGIYTALGWHANRVILMIGMEALIITMSGGLVGAILGAAGLNFLVRVTELKAYIDPQLDLMVIIQTFCVSVLLGSLASIYPAWRAVCVNPVDALKYE